MTMNTKLALGAAAAIAAYFLFVRKASAATTTAATSSTRPTCGSGAFWKVVSDPTGYSPSVAASIRQWGGYCAQSGLTEFLGADNKAEQPSLVDGLITMPSQLD